MMLPKKTKERQHGKTDVGGDLTLPPPIIAIGGGNVKFWFCFGFVLFSARLSALAAVIRDVK